MAKALSKKEARKIYEEEVKKEKEKLVAEAKERARRRVRQAAKLKARGGARGKAVREAIKVVGAGKAKEYAKEQYSLFKKRGGVIGAAGRAVKKGVKKKPKKQTVKEFMTLTLVGTSKGPTGFTAKTIGVGKISPEWRGLPPKKKGKKTKPIKWF